MDTGQVILEYTGPGAGTQTFRAASGREYRAGQNAARRYIVVEPDDAVSLIALGFFTRHAAPAPFVPPPLVEEPLAEEVKTDTTIDTAATLPERAARKAQKVPA